MPTKRTFTKRASSGEIKKGSDTEDPLSGHKYSVNLVREAFQNAGGRAVKNLRVAFCGDDTTKVYFGIAYIDRAFSGGPGAGDGGGRDIDNNPSPTGNMTPFSVRGGETVTISGTDFTAPRNPSSQSFGLVLYVDQSGGGDPELHYAATWYEEE